MTQSTYHSPDSQRQLNLNDGEYDKEDGTLIEDPDITRERNEERERADARNRARDQAQAVSNGRSEDHKPNASFGTSFLGNHDTEEQWQQWRQIQADFVDNPQSAVSDAHGLVGRLIDDIVGKFNNERNQLEQRWSSGEDVSTEDLRTCLQTYRDFFGRLLATNEPKH
jgi:hypothetical protein